MPSLEIPEELIPELVRVRLDDLTDEELIKLLVLVDREIEHRGLFISDDTYNQAKDDLQLAVSFYPKN